MKNSLSLFTFLILSFSFLSCGRNNEKQLIGKWKYIDDKGTIEFTSSKDVILKQGQDTYSGSYKFISADRVLLNFGKSLTSSTLRISFDNNRMIVKDESKNVYRHLLNIYNMRYDQISDFSDDMARIKVNNKYGFIDSYGNETIMPSYDYAEDFINSICLVKNNGYFSLIGKHGEILNKQSFPENDNLTDKKPDEKFVYMYAFGDYVSHGMPVGWKPDIKKHGKKITEFAQGGILSSSSILDTTITLNGIEKYILVTSSNAEGNDCHACAPFVSVFVFSRLGSKWFKETSDYYIDEIGQYGSPDKVHIQQTGLNRISLIFEGSYMGQGLYENYTLIYSFFNNHFSLGLSIQTHGDNSGTGEEKSWAFNSTYKFVNGSDPEYNDIAITSAGENYDYDKDRIISMNKEEVYKFQNGKYIKFEKQGIAAR